VKAQLRSLGTDYARIVGRHLVATHLYLESDPELAWRHALAARRRAARLGVVREAVGLAAYHSGRYADALAEFRTARRLTGSSTTLPLMADSERGLGRPERALELARTPEARALDQDGRIELLIVTAGARTDLGEPEAAVVALQIPELETDGEAPWLARLRSAYADALEALGRTDEAATWRARALAADPSGEAGITDVSDEDEIVVLDLLDEDPSTPEEASPAATDDKHPAAGEAAPAATDGGRPPARPRPTGTGAGAPAAAEAEPAAESELRRGRARSQRPQPAR
jgi:tetratricopeptide (TPR) repeat protein